MSHQADPNRVRAFMRAAARDVAAEDKLAPPERCQCCGELFAPHHAKIYGHGVIWHRDEENCGYFGAPRGIDS